MTGGRYTLYGVYVTRPVADALANSLYESAGIIDLQNYFDETARSLPDGDPGAEAADALLEPVADEFAALYDEARFDAAEQIDHDAFDLVHLTGTPKRVTRLRELFEAAATIQDTDLQTVQTAILAAALDVDLNGEDDRSPSV